MKMRHILNTFRKDGLELLRDRRTIFVNVLLPVLLYPLVALFLIQIAQLVQMTQRYEDLPGVAAPGAPALLQEVLDDYRGERAAWEEDPGAVHLRPVSLDEDARETLAELTAEAEADRTADLPAGEQTRALGLLRQHDASADLLTERQDDGTWDVTVVHDAANPHWEQAAGLIDRIVARWQQAERRQRLEAMGVQHSVVEVAQPRLLSVAPPSEALRTRLAAVVPIILVLMGLVGAFYPALDLIAGERERGTLELLVSWPAGRRELFLGKLLVVAVAALISVLLNIGSFALTIAIAVKPLLGGNEQMADIVGPLIAAGGDVLLLSLLLLLPIILTLATLSLAIAGMAASYKEATNYLTPFTLLVTVAATVALVPGIRASVPLDLVPITGPIVVLKETIQGQSIPWLHLAVSIGASVAVAAVVMLWSVRLLESERFLFPQQGGGRVRRQPATRASGAASAPAASEPGADPPPPPPTAMHAWIGYSLVVLLFVSLSAVLLQSPLPPAWAQILAMLGGVGLPPLIWVWWTRRDPADTLFLRAPPLRAWWASLLAIPVAIALSIGFGILQMGLQEWFGLSGGQSEQEMEDMLFQMAESGGWMLLIAAAVMPGFCEEVFCRGFLLRALRTSLGTTSAVLVSALLFGALHMSPERFLPQAALGVALAIFVLRTGSLWPAVLIHFGHNAFLIAGHFAGQHEAESFNQAPTGAAAKLLAQPLLYAPIIILIAAGLLALLIWWASLRPADRTAREVLPS